MAKHKHTEDELKQHLEEKRASLKTHCALYDADERNRWTAKSLAVDVRVLVHDTNGSKSLLSQLRLKDGLKFFCTPGKAPGAQWSHLIRVDASADGSVRFVPVLNDVSSITFDFSDADVSKPFTPETFQQARRVEGWLRVTFEEWWNGEILWADGSPPLSRRDVTLGLANQDGGAHVDPGLDPDYAEYARLNALGWEVWDGTESKPVEPPQHACMRQIAHELLRTIE